MTDPDPTTSMRKADQIVSASRTIAAPAAEIFDLLADPTRHAEIDGSGMVQRSRPGSEGRLQLGSTFGMDMKFAGLVPYRISNEVVEFDEGRCLAWRHFGGHVWRYELEPIDAATTRVTESFDWGVAKVPKAYELIGYPSQHERNMSQTLERLEQAVTN